MVLRRLLSGWLIAVAALARSMALVLERAAADRSAPTPNSVPGPVMAALAERYPGAPDHWLALVAERTSRLAEAGAAPLSLSSQPSAWPASLPGAAGPLEPLMPTTLAEDEAVPRAPPRPVAHTPARGDDVPSLAVLQGRSSEVWRRPQGAQARRPRPVFAPVEPASPRPASTSASDAPTARRPRSPLTLDIGKLSPSPGATLSPAAELPERVAPQPNTSFRGVERPAEGAFMAPPAAPKAGPRSTDRPEQRARRSDAPDAAPSFSRALSFGPPAVLPSARDAVAFAPTVDAPPRGAPCTMNQPINPTPATVEPPAFPSSSVGPVARRSIFRTLAALGERPRAASVLHRHAATKSAPSGIALSPTDPRSDHKAQSPAPPSHGPEAAPPAAPTPRAVAHGGDAPSIPSEPRAVMRSTPRRPSPTWAPSFANDEASRDPRANFAISRPPSASNGSPRTARSSSDDRWPRFPPNVFAPPVVAEIPSPRLDQLAREQEEGRWSV